MLVPYYGLIFTALLFSLIICYLCHNQRDAIYTDASELDEDNVSDSEVFLADFDTYVALNLEGANNYLERAIEKYLIGDKQGAIIDIEVMIELAPD